MIKINDTDRNNLGELCFERKDDAGLLWFLDGNSHCVAWVDTIEHPKVAVIIVADFCYLIGEVEAPNEVVSILLEHARYKVIIACGKQWDDFIKEYLEGQYSCYKRYRIKREPDVFDKSKLKQFIHRIDGDYEIRKIDEDIYNEVLNIDWAADGCCFFKSYDEFEEKGLGYVIVKDNQLVCIASSYTTYLNGITVTIGTLEEHRRKGLATACASSLILDCIDSDIYPEWEAANLNSVALAEKLGYHFDKEFDVYSLI